LTKPNPGSRPRFSWIQAVLAFAIIAFLFFWLQFSTPDICCGDFDGYYHIHWSRLLGEGIGHGHLPAFSWLPLTSLNAHDYADQHLLFHLMLIPFTWLATPVLAAKITAALFGSIAVFSCVWIILHFRLRYAAIWLLPLLGSSSLFLYRMSMTRAQSLSVIFIMAGICLLFEKKYGWLAVAAFLYVWTYNLFVILIVMALFWTATLWWSEKRVEWRPMLWTAIGTVAGFILHPYFPNNLRLFHEHLLAKATEPSLPSGAGSEWYAMPSWQLVTSSFVALAAMVVGYLAFGYLLGRDGRDRAQRPLFLLALATLLLLVTARSKRFAEYWPPCAVLFAAFSLQAVGEVASRSEEKKQASAQATPAWKLATWQAAVIICALISALAYQLWQARSLIALPTSPDQYRAGAQWLLDHVPRDATIFNASWDDFPKLFYYDDQHAYVTGLDPMYLSDHNPELGHLYDRLVSGRQGHPGEHIRQAFAADYVFVTPSTPRSFYTSAMLSGGFTKVYEDSQCMILKVREMDSGAE
jgi:hypothetical protein